MTWLERARIIYRNIIAEENRDKSTHVSIHSEEDIPEDLSKIKSVSIAWDYDERDPVALISEIIGKAPELTSISICPEIVWGSLCRPDLTKIESLSVYLSEFPDDSVVSAPALKSLRISQHKRLAPMERMLTPTPHFDFSQTPLLEKLILLDLQMFDPADIRDLRCLKHLSIYDSGLSDLNWLADAAYRLTYLSVEKDIADCHGIEAQTELESVDLPFNLISDVSPLEQLGNLKRLRLYPCELSSEGRLRGMNIEWLEISEQDSIRNRVQNSVYMMLDAAVQRFRSDEKRYAKIDELPQKNTSLLRSRMQRPAMNRLQYYIRWAYDTRINNIDKLESYDRRVPKEEYRKMLTEAFQEYFPFLAETGYYECH